jgi:hypothetical protein
LFYDRPVNHPFINYFPVILEYFGDWFRRFLFLTRPATAARQRLCDCTLTSLNLPYRPCPVITIGHIHCQLKYAFMEISRGIILFRRQAFFS